MKSAIIKTLCYSQVFNFPLKANEIHTRLIGCQTTNSKVKTMLNRQTDIRSINGYYYLKDPKIVEQRLKREAISQAKIAIASKLIPFLKFFHGVEAVFITGAVSVGNAHAQDDIDLLIVTKASSLWTTRFLVNIALDLFSLRRKPFSRQINNMLCINLWLTTESLAVPKSSQNLYSAYEVIQTKMLFDRSNVHEQFLSENSWILSFLPNAMLPSISHGYRQSKPQKLIEKIFFFIQKMYMKTKITREKIDEKSAFFHPQNTSQLVLKKYQQLVNQYL